METYCLINAGGMPRWSILKTDKDGALVWMDFKGRRTPYAEGKVIGHVSGDGFERAMRTIPEHLVKVEQDYAYRFLLDPYSNQGWLSPDGKFYGCKYYEHDDLAYALIRVPTMGLEYNGWVRVHDEIFRRPVIGEITKRQEAVLVKLGFEPWEDRKRRRFELDRSAPPPRYAVKPPADLVLPEDLDDEDDHLDVGLDRLVERFREYELLAELLGVEHELVPDVGPGTWEWMIHWGDLDIGSEETADDLLRSEGLHLRKTSFDTIEISSWPFPELSCGPVERSMIERQLEFRVAMAV